MWAFWLWYPCWYQRLADAYYLYLRLTIIRLVCQLCTMMFRSRSRGSRSSDPDGVRSMTASVRSVACRPRRNADLRTQRSRRITLHHATCLNGTWRATTAGSPVHTQDKHRVSRDRRTRRFKYTGEAGTVHSPHSQLRSHTHGTETRITRTNASQNRSTEPPRMSLPRP